MTKRLADVASFEPCCYDDFTQEDKDMMVRVSKALGNEARLEIYNYLMAVNVCFTGSLVAYLPLAQSTISQHLKVMEKAGIITGTVEGTSTSYCINHELMSRYYKLLGRMVK